MAEGIRVRLIAFGHLRYRRRHRPRRPEEDNRAAGVSEVDEPWTDEYP